MVAFARHSPRHGLPFSWWAQFEFMVPEIEERAENAFRSLTLKRREELVAEVTDYAFHLFVYLSVRGKAEYVHGRPLAVIAIRQVATSLRSGLPTSRRR
jgi:hypothetical protein